MIPNSVTRASLLLRIRDPQDRMAWSDFVDLYAPLIHRYGLCHGLQDADAADLVQEVLKRVNLSAHKFHYDPAKGSFRGWLLTVTRNELRKMAARRQRQAVGSGDSEVQQLLAEQSDDSSDDPQWDSQYRWQLFQWAAERVRGEFREATWQAFWRTGVESQSVAAVAQQLGISAGAVYIARSRVSRRLRQEIATIGDS